MIRAKGEADSSGIDGPIQHDPEHDARSSRLRFGIFRKKLGENKNRLAFGDTPGRPDPDDPKSKPDRERTASIWARYRQWLWPYRWQITGLFLLAAFAAILEMASPAAGGLIIDKVLLNKNLDLDGKFDRLNLAGMLLVGILLTARVIETWRTYKLAVLNNKVVFRLRRHLHERMIRLPLDDLYRYKVGGIVSRLSGDVDQVSGLMQMALISPVVAAIKVVFALVVLLVWNWQLALAAMAILPAAIWVSVAYIGRVKPIYHAARDDRGRVDARVAETFGGIRVVRSFRREKREQRDYAVGHHTVIRKDMYARVIEMIVDVVWELMIPAIVLMIVWLGGVLYLHDRATIGQITAFQAYVALLMWPIFRIVFSISQMQRALAGMDRVFEVLDRLPDKPDAPDALDAPSEVREYAFNNVWFEYRKDTPVIRDFSLKVPGGSVVALVGPSGAGKTTLTDLVARFQDPTSGAITLNGIDIRRFKLESYRSLLAVVEQEVFLFDGSVRDNIAYGRPHATDDEVVEAARRANADVFITEMPHGYDTVIGERGLKLSGGQRQRISIARAILADPKVLILDEATSNLDSHSEYLIQQALAELYRDRTTFVIAHRLSTVTHADMIVVMDKGVILEVGRHDELMAREGAYAAMVERQRRAFDAVEDLEVQAGMDGG